MRLMVIIEYLIIPKGMKFTESGKLGFKAYLIKINGYMICIFKYIYQIFTQSIKHNYDSIRDHS